MIDYNNSALPGVNTDVANQEARNQQKEESGSRMSVTSVDPAPRSEGTGGGNWSPSPANTTNDPGGVERNPDPPSRDALSNSELRAMVNTLRSQEGGAKLTVGKLDGAISWSMRNRSKSHPKNRYFRYFSGSASRVMSDLEKRVPGALGKTPARADDPGGTDQKNVLDTQNNEPDSRGQTAKTTTADQGFEILGFNGYLVILGIIGSIVAYNKWG